MATITTAELAEALHTTPRTLRKFLRDDFKAREKGDELPGKGARYAIEKREVKALGKRFTAWQEAAEAKKAKPAETAEVEIDENDED